MFETFFKLGMGIQTAVLSKFYLNLQIHGKTRFLIKFSANKTEHNFNLVSPILVNPQIDTVSGITNLI